MSQADAYFMDTDGLFKPVTASFPLPVDATVSASVSGFAPNGDVATLAVTGSTGRVALPSGATVVLSNAGTATAYVRLGNGSVTAATDDLAVFASGSLGLTVGGNTHIAALTATGTTTLNLTAGSGLYT